MYKYFKSPDKKYIKGKFNTTARPKSPSPKRKDYQQVAVRSSDHHSRCTYIHPDTNKRCKLTLGLYPKYCHVHTMLIENLYISKSNIENGGNGLFVGPLGFKKGDIIGKYSEPWMKLKYKSLDKRENLDTSYLFCEDGKKNQKEGDIICYDGIDIRSTIVRNANDAHGSPFKNNCTFDITKSGYVYVVASRNIRPHKEIFVNYGNEYFANHQ